MIDSVASRDNVRNKSGLDGLIAAIVVYNGEKWYRACLQSLLAAGLSAENIVVVENASTDNTADRIAEEFPDVLLRRMPKNLGAGGGCNEALRIALEKGAANILLLNIDVTVAPDMPRRLLEAARKNSEYGILSPVQYGYSGDKLDENFARMHPPEQVFSARGIIDAETVIGAGVLLTRRMVETVGGFDETYFIYGEEDDLCRRARWHGFKIGVVPGANLRHWHMAINASPNPRIRRLRFRNQFLYMLKDPTHSLPRHFYYYLRYYVWRRLRAAARQHDWQSLAEIPMVQFSLLARGHGILANRRREREGRWHL